MWQIAQKQLLFFFKFIVYEKRGLNYDVKIKKRLYQFHDDIIPRFAPWN